MPRIGKFWFSPELYYTLSHTWAKIIDNNYAIIGIDDFAAKMLKEIVNICLRPVGSVVRQFESIGELESMKWVGDISSPLSGVIKEINEEAVNNPSLIINDPYGKGWLIKIEPSNLENELKNLLHGDKALEWFTKEVKETGV